MIRRLAALPAVTATWLALLSVGAAAPNQKPTRPAQPPTSSEARGAARGAARDPARDPARDATRQANDAVIVPARVVGEVTHLVWLDESTLLAGNGDGGLHRVRTADGTIVNSWRTGSGLESLAVSPGSESIVAASGGGALRVIDPADASLRQTIRGVRGRVRALAVTADARRVAAASRDRALLFDGNGALLRDVVCPYRIRSLAFGPDGAWLAIARDDPRLHIVDVESGSTAALVREHRVAIAVVRAAPGGRLATGSDDGTVHIWQVAPGGAPRVVRALSPLGASIIDLAFDGEGERLVAAASDGTVALFDASTGVRLTEARVADVAAVAISPDGATVATGGRAGLRIVTFRRSDLARPEIDLGLELATLRILERSGVPVRLEVRLHNATEKRTGPLDVGALVQERAAGEAVRVEDIEPGRLSPRLFFDLPDVIRTGRLDAWEIAVSARSHIDSTARFAHEETLTVRMPELAVADVEVYEPPAARPVLRFSLVRPPAIDAGPGPLRVRSAVRVGDRILGDDERVVDLDGTRSARIEVLLPERLDDAVDRSPTLTLATVSTRERWPSQSFRTETTLSTRPPRLELLQHRIEVDASGAPVAVELELRNAERTGVGPLEIALVSPPNPDAPEETELVARTRAPVPSEKPFTARIELGRPLGARLAEGVDRPLRVRAYRPGWPGRAWSRDLKLPSGKLDLRLDSLRLVGGGPTSPAQARVTFSNLETVDVGPVDLAILLDGRKAGSVRFSSLPPTERGGEPFEAVLDLAAESMPRASAGEFELTVRAVRPEIRGTEWTRSASIVTGDPRLRIVEERFAPGERGAPAFLVLRLRNVADRDPGILRVTGRVSRPGRRLDEAESVTVHRIGPLAEGEETGALRFRVPWAAIMGGVDADGIRLELELERSFWEGRTQRIEKTVLRRPKTGLADFSVLGDEAGRPRAIRFDLVNELDLELGLVRLRAVYEAGLRGAEIASAEADRFLEVGPGERLGPIEIPIPEDVLPVFESSDYLKVRVATEHPDWPELSSTATRLVPTREPRIALHSMNVERASDVSEPEARIVLRNEDRIDSQPMRVAVDFRDATTGGSLVGDPTWLPVPPIAARSVTGPLRFPVPAAAVEAILAGDPVDLTIALRGPMRPIDLERSLRASRALDPDVGSGFPWLPVLAVVFLGIPAALAAGILVRRHLAARAATTEFFALVEMDEDERGDGSLEGGGDGGSDDDYDDYDDDPDRDRYAGRG